MLTAVTLIVVLATVQAGVTHESRLVDTFLQNETTQHWTLDRISNRNLVSVSATGTGFYAYAVASKLGRISREDAARHIRSGFDSMLECNKGYDGWLLHFVDSQGKPANETEVSSIDTVLFYLSAERAARLLKDDALLRHILACKEKISLSAMIDSEGFFYHAFSAGSPRVMSRWKWKNYDEGILIYKYFNKPFKPAKIQYDLPLFVYYYICAFYPEWDTIEHLRKAIDFQLETTGRFGYSAMDGQSGYTVNSPYYVSPLAVTSCKRFFPLKVEDQLCRWNVDPLLPAMTVNKGWRSHDKVMLDQGIALILLYKE